jgi:hypothetical protein
MPSQGVNFSRTLTNELALCQHRYFFTSYILADYILLAIIQGKLIGKKLEMSRFCQYVFV